VIDHPTASAATGSAVIRRSQRLRTILSLARGSLTDLVCAVWYHPRLGELYPEFLFAMLGVMRASVPVMRRAADRSSEVEGYPIREQLREYYLEHAMEEQGHEEWLLEDLASLGIARDRALRRLPYPSIAALVGTQYYWIEHVHPAAFLGYLAVLEQPAETMFLHDVHHRTGIPLASMTCHLKHAELDPGHVAEFDTFLDRLPLTQEQEELITVSAIATISHLEKVFADIAEHFDRIENPTLRHSVFTVCEMPATAAAIV
jgi:hypothetical protein